MVLVTIEGSYSNHASDITNVLCENKNNNWKFKFKKKVYVNIDR